MTAHFQALRLAFYVLTSLCLAACIVSVVQGSLWAPLMGLLAYGCFEASECRR